MNKTPWDVLRALYTHEINAGVELVRNAETGEWLSKAWIAGHSYGWSDRKLLERTFRADEFDQIAGWLASEALTCETLARNDTGAGSARSADDIDPAGPPCIRWEDSIESQRWEDS
jgi:hypothetical protein